MPSAPIAVQQHLSFSNHSEEGRSSEEEKLQAMQMLPPKTSAQVVG